MHLGILSVMPHPSALMIVVVMFGHFSDGGVKIRSLILSEKINFVLEFLYFANSVCFSNGLPLRFLLQLKTVNHLLQPLPLFLLLC